MKKASIFTILTLSIAFMLSCTEESTIPESVLENRIITITSNVISTDFVGNGAQWGGYDVVDKWLGTETLSDADWATMFERIDYMRPPFVRILTNASDSYDNNGTFDPNYKTASLFKMLDYCQDKSIEVVYGEWGHHYLNDTRTDIDTTWVEMSVEFINYLINTKGYTCINTLNIINEPNGSWSSANGDYTAWLNTQQAFIDEMKNYTLTNVKITGPDVVAWDTHSTDWLTKASTDLGDNMGHYDIHGYPEQVVVRNGDYQHLLQAYKDATPEGSKIILGEIGFKYTEVDVDLKAENEAAIAADPYAGEDSNMKIYEAFYGIDMADAIIQSMIAGFSGALVWSMDDAMYCNPEGDNYQTDVLKRWGFWNSVGEELCGDAEDENLRPHFYPTSLLCRYIPAGSDIYEIELPNKVGVRAIMAKKDDRYTIAIVNSHYTTYPVVLKANDIAELNLNRYDYKSHSDGSFTGLTDDNGFATPSQDNITVNLKDGYDITLEGESFILLSNMD